MEKQFELIYKKLEKSIKLLDYDIYSAEEVSNLLKDIYYDDLPKIEKILDNGGKNVK